MKKTRLASHPKKFEARAPDGHHRDYILLLFVGLARRALLFVFLFSFLSDSRIVSHLPFACKWQNMASSKTCFGIVNLLLLISRVTKVRLWTYESHAALRSYTPPHVCMICVVCMGWAQAIRRNKMFCLLFF